MCPLAQSEPYLQRKTLKAAPKRISRRTSYLLVRLAFHPYPQVIQRICNSDWFAPPRGVTHASRCPWIAHQVSGLHPATSVALFRLAFAPAPRLPSLNLATERNSSAHSSIGTPSHGPKSALRLLVSAWFQVLFHSPSGVLFTFPSRYWYAIGRQGYLALESGLPSFPRDFTCPVVLRIPTGVDQISPTGLSPSAAGRSRTLWLSERLLTPERRSYNPACTRQTVWALPRSLAATRRIISFPRGT
jgi:hypothetical protein